MLVAPVHSIFTIMIVVLVVTFILPTVGPVSKDLFHVHFLIHVGNLLKLCLLGSPRAKLASDLSVGKSSVTFCD